MRGIGRVLLILIVEIQGFQFSNLPSVWMRAYCTSLNGAPPAAPPQNVQVVVVSRASVLAAWSPESVRGAPGAHCAVGIDGRVPDFAEGALSEAPGDVETAVVDGARVKAPGIGEGLREHPFPDLGSFPRVQDEILAGGKPKERCRSKK